MRQINITYSNHEEFVHNLLDLKADLTGQERIAYFFIYASECDKSMFQSVVDDIKNTVPDIRIAGCTTNGNLDNCSEKRGYLISAVILQEPSTIFKLLHINIAGRNLEEISASVRRGAQAVPWASYAEIYHTIPTYSMTKYCQAFDFFGEKFRFMGGIVACHDMSGEHSFLYSSIQGFTDEGVFLLILGGETFHAETLKLGGWRPVGKQFQVTKHEGTVLNTLDNKPAFHIYQKYLKIENNENFTTNTLEFPMLYHYQDTTITRAVMGVKKDGSLILSSDIDDDLQIRLSYGEPATILREIEDGARRIEEFSPQIMHIISCVARQAFWGGNAEHELHSLKDICTSSGLVADGQFIREHGHLNQHNVTVVLSCLREGDAQKTNCEKTVTEPKDTRYTLATRMATFVSEVTYELEEINRRLSETNSQLSGVAIFDSLTGLENRYAFDAKLSGIMEKDLKDSNWILIMMDVNGLKYVNDTYGHDAGDELIRSAAKVIKESYGKEGDCYRIGGDEFIVLLNVANQVARRLEKDYEEVLSQHNQTALYKLSIAKGQSSLRNNAGQIKTLSDWKQDADLAMYADKTKAHKHCRTQVKPGHENLTNLINCLINAQEAKDCYTVNHSVRVKEISGLLCALLACSEEEKYAVVTAAYLHDIGKIGISDSVLMKPGALTSEEFEIVKQHTVIGARILAQSSFTQDIIEIVLHHHERYDGTGYPDRLKGTVIPKGARIIAIADAIDAMTSKRVYRHEMPLSLCKEELKSHLGTQFDPELGKLALEHWDRIEDIVMMSPRTLKE